MKAALSMTDTKEIISISASKIKLAFEDCYGKYHYKYVLKKEVSEVVWPGTTLGEIIHKFIENSINAINNNININDFKKTIMFENIFEEYLTNYKKNKKLFKWSKDTSKKEFLIKGQKYSELFVKFIYGFIESEKEEGVEFLPEHKIELFENNIKVSGIIDLFIKKPDINKVIDFKTTKDWNKWFYVDWFNDIQSLMYLKLIFSKWELFVSSYDYLILDHTKKTIFFKNYEYTQEDVKEKIELINRVINKLVSMHKQEPDKKYFQPEKTKCFFCDFKDFCKLKVV